MSKNSFSTEPEKTVPQKQQPNRGVKFVSTIAAVAFLFFFAQFVAVILVMIGLELKGVDSQQVTSVVSDNVAWQLVLSLGVATLTSAGIWFILRIQHEEPLKFLLLSNKPTIKQLGEVFLTYGVYFLVLIIVSVLVSAFSGIDVNQAQELGIKSPNELSELIIVFIMLAVIPPIYEEIIFRGFLFNKLKGYSSYLIAAVVTSILFGVAHLEYENLNWIAAIDTLIFSYFLIYISQKHQSLYSAILLHGIKNAIAFYVLFVAGV